MLKEQSFLGTGWSFPPSFEPAIGSVITVSGVEDILQSLDILLSTSLGERVMQPKYGANLEQFVFEPINSSLILQLTDVVRTAILYHEARIELQRVNIQTDRQLEGVLGIEVDFVIRSTNSRFNYVYPFYLKEGTEIPTTNTPTT